MGYLFQCRLPVVEKRFNKRKQVTSQLYFRHKNLQLQNIQFSNTEINIEIKTATAVIKNELKYFSNDESSDDTYLK